MFADPWAFSWYILNSTNAAGGDDDDDDDDDDVVFEFSPPPPRGKTSSNRLASLAGQAQSSLSDWIDDSPQLEPTVNELPNTATISGRRRRLPRRRPDDDDDDDDDDSSDARSRAAKDRAGPGLPVENPESSRRGVSTAPRSALNSPTVERALSSSSSTDSNLSES